MAGSFYTMISLMRHVPLFKCTYLLQCEAPLSSGLQGTRNFNPEQMVIRKNLEELIIAIFKQHEPQAVAIDTPVMERTEVLKGNYGDDSKLIYNLADQCGEQLSLRYDLTVYYDIHLQIIV